MVELDKEISSQPLCAIGVRRYLMGKGYTGAYQCMPGSSPVRDSLCIAGYCWYRSLHRDPSTPDSSYTLPLLEEPVQPVRASEHRWLWVRDVPAQEKCDAARGEYWYRRSQPACDRQNRRWLRLYNDRCL